MKIRIRIQDVEISFDDENTGSNNTPLAYEQESKIVLSAVKSMTDDCIKAHEATINF